MLMYICMKNSVCISFQAKKQIVNFSYINKFVNGANHIMFEQKYVRLNNNDEMFHQCW